MQEHSKTTRISSTEQTTREFGYPGDNYSNFVYVQEAKTVPSSRNISRGD